MVELYPLKEHFAHHVYYNVNVDKMIEAAKYLIGKHNFKSFIQIVKLLKEFNNCIIDYYLLFYLFLILFKSNNFSFF